jgi:glycosyltransferase involved in cell wall biosynthesis
LKILHYLDDFDFSKGGVVQFVYQACQSLAENDLDVTLVAGRGPDIPAAWSGPSLPGQPHASTLSRPAGRQGWLGRGQLREALQLARNHDVVHLHGPWDLGNVRLAHRLFQSGIPYVVSVHGMLDDWSLQQKPTKKQVFLKLFVNRLLRRAAVVHCTAQAEMEQVSKHVPGLTRVECVVPIVDLPDEATVSEVPRNLVYEQFPQVQRDSTKLLFLSRIHVKKGLESLLDAMQLIKKRHPSIQLLMAGPGDAAYVESLKQRAADRDVADVVIWMDMVREPLKSALFLESTVFVLPTFQENFGIVLVEAMALGLPVVTTTGTDIHREIADGGAVISGNRAEELAASIVDLVSDPQRMAQRANQGKRYVREWLDEDHVVAQFASMYEQANRQSCQAVDPPTQ